MLTLRQFRAAPYPLPRLASPGRMLLALAERFGSLTMPPRQPSPMVAGPRSGSAFDQITDP